MEVLWSFDHDNLAGKIGIEERLNLFLLLFSQLFRACEPTPTLFFFIFHHLLFLSLEKISFNPIMKVGHLHLF